MINPMAGLIPAPQSSSTLKLRDAEVVSVGPLSVRLDGDTEPVEPTKVPLVAGLANGQRVCCMIVDRQLYVLGRYGG